MDPGRPESWRDLFLMLGTTAGALIGLLFVVTSLHLDDIVRNPVYRVRARNNSLYLLVLVIESAAVLTPQSQVALGLELLLVSVVMLQLHVRIIYRFHVRESDVGRRGGFSIRTAYLFVASRGAGCIGALILIADRTWGLYFTTAGCLLSLTAIVLNAWTIMLGVGESR